MALAVAEGAVTALENVITAKQEDVNQAQAEVTTAEAELAAKQAILEFRELYRNNRELAAAATKAALDQAEQGKRNTESDLEDALFEVELSNANVENADGAYQVSKDAAEATNVAMANAQSAWQLAVDNLNNDAGTQDEVDSAEAAGIAAAQVANSNADSLRIAADNKVTATESAQEKIGSAETVIQADITAGEQLGQAQSANSFAEADAQSGEAEVQVAEQDRDNAADNLSAKRGDLRAAKDPLQQMQEAASGPKGLRDRAEFDRDQAQNQVAACLLSPICNGGARDDPPAVDCTAKQQAVNLATTQLAAAEATCLASRAAADLASDDVTIKIAALATTQTAYNLANAAYTAALATERAAASDLKGAMASATLSSIALVLAQRFLVVKIVEQVAALVLAAGSWGIFSALAVAAAVSLTLAIVAEAVALAGYYLVMTNVANKAAAVAAARSAIGTALNARIDAGLLAAQAKSDLATARTLRNAARTARNAAETARDAKKNELRGKEVELKDCLEKQAAMGA